MMENYETTCRDNATYIDWSEISDEEKKEKAELLNEYNGNRINFRGKKNENQIHREDCFHVLDATASSLRLTDGQKKEVKRIFDEGVDSLNRGVEEVAFACCVVVANRDAEGKRYWPDSSYNDERFENFAERNDLDPLPAINQVKENLDYE